MTVEYILLYTIGTIYYDYYIIVSRLVDNKVCRVRTVFPEKTHVVKPPLSVVRLASVHAISSTKSPKMTSFPFTVVSFIVGFVAAVCCRGRCFSAHRSMRRRRLVDDMLLFYGYCYDYYYHHHHILHTCK